MEGGKDWAGEFNMIHSWGRTAALVLLYLVLEVGLGRG